MRRIALSTMVLTISLNIFAGVGSTVLRSALYGAKTGAKSTNSFIRTVRGTQFRMTATPKALHHPLKDGDSFVDGIKSVSDGLILRVGRITNDQPANATIREIHFYQHEYTLNLAEGNRIFLDAKNGVTSFRAELYISGNGIDVNILTITDRRSIAGDIGIFKGPQPLRMSDFESYHFNIFRGRFVNTDSFAKPLTEVEAQEAFTRFIAN